jgi:hypothetical protein
MNYTQALLFGVPSSDRPHVERLLRHYMAASPEHQDGVAGVITSVVAQALQRDLIEQRGIVAPAVVKSVSLIACVRALIQICAQEDLELVEGKADVETQLRVAGHVANIIIKLGMRHDDGAPPPEKRH